MASMLDQLHRDLLPKILGAHLRLGLLNQDQWWVPQPGWKKLQQLSLTTVVLQPLAPAAVEIADGPPLTHHQARLTLEPLDENTGEKIAVAGIDAVYRERITGFLWNGSVELTRNLAMADLINPDPLTCDGGGNLDRARHQITERYLQLSSDSTARRRWFDQLPLIIALRGTSPAGA